MISLCEPPCLLSNAFHQQHLWRCFSASGGKILSLTGNCGFLAANLYAKSVFGEDALVNLSVEKGSDGKLSGYIRIRYLPFT